MASYIPAASETLHLMQNQGYGGGTCADASGNLMLIPHESAVDMNDPSMGYLMSQMQLPNMSSPLSTSIRMYSSTVQQQSSPSLLSSGHHIHGNNTPNFSNWSATTNEFSFLPSTEATQMNHSLTARLTSNMAPSDQLQLGSNLAHFNLGHHSVQDHEQQASMMNEEAVLRLNMASCAPSVLENRPHQSGLSLSLSSHGNPMQMQFLSGMPSSEPVPGLSHGHAGEEFEYKDGMKMLNADMSTSLRRSLADGAPVQAILHNYVNDPSRQTICVQQPEFVAGAFTRSKYLKAAQCLLDEVVTVVDVIKRKHEKTGHQSSKEGITLGLSMMKAGPSGDLTTSVNADQLALQDKQQLQMKKSRLMSMLEEVDRRYKVYHIQMQTIINSFESVAGANAAHSYTTLALQTISKHFRSLRDAIAGQIRVMGKALGEEEQPYNYQHRAFQQLQLMQQHAWRPQRGLPERAVSILRAWLFEHFLHPYPKDADKVMLANQTGLTRNQVSNWFINARVRLWKPMVEEMYQEEAKESDGPQDERSNDTERDIEEADLKESSASLRNPASNSPPNGEDKKNLSDESQREAGSHHQLIRLADRNSNVGETNRDPDLLLHDAKKSRRSAEGFGFKTEAYSDGHHNLKGEYGIKEYGSKMSWGMESPASVTINPNPTLTRGTIVMPRNNVSLTLGLQNSDPLEAQCHQQPYLQREPGHDNSNYPHQISSNGRQDIDRSAGNGVQDYYYSMAAANSGDNNELFSLLQNRKGFVGNVLQHGFTS